MKSRSMCRATAWLLALCAGAALAQGPKINWGIAQPTVPNLAPVGTPPEPEASTWYLAGWGLDDAGAPPGPGSKVAPPRLTYCVKPSVKVTSRGMRDSPPWTRTFSLSLVDAAGNPADPSFRPVEVPVPIAADTTVELPRWCGVVTGVRQPPELYLQAGGKRERARVVFPPAPGPLPRPMPMPAPKPASSNR